ncbi:MAG: adenosylcobalamin-dependent ribonucleoside-diphosphate reductase [Candidatus Marsarchaeota archaeon]|jgi:ribonucleoside-diphosphate reductase alpha chain|nr:adenosylcobalamin-dependent ribonucleoside-diphosphate reductase [Candidatus Marsarchaeota archaeon]MCL5418313.1 adenosylcobalamin-dependent ribonucleoside-diphosphate reductase [Candidatus Marsarchaeota archaeon]
MADENFYPKFVVKRTGERVQFDTQKIENAIYSAFAEIYPKNADEQNSDKSREVTSTVVKELRNLKKDELSVEEIQDIIEMVLMKSDPNVAKAYILYRSKHAQMRALRASLGIPTDELKVPLNSLTVLAARYLLKNDEGKIIETPKQMFERVANAISSSERNYGKGDEEVRRIAGEFYDAMSKFYFMPNSPTLMNAGTRKGQLSACFVIPVGDSISEIFDAVKYAAMIHQSGGGTGFAFSRLRPANDIVRSTHGVASGPISFMKVFDAATEEIKQGGKRRGANMGVLRIDHPNVLDFIVAKESEGVLSNFNISVAVTDSYMRALKAGTDYPLINPRDGTVTARLNAKAVWNLIVTMAWKTGDPGVVFIDRMNSSYSNPVPSFGPIESTNPCGEQPLYPYDSCNLASINLSKMLNRKNSHYEIDWDMLKKITRLGIRFLDDVIDANAYPLPDIERVTKAIRRVGLGVMGWADMLIRLGIRYDSNEALALAEKVMSFITENARKMSMELAEERGPFPEFSNSIWARLGYKPLRNSTVTTIAPTGTISIISGGASQGIEPIFSVVYTRNVQESLGSNLIEVNNEFEEYALEYNFYSDELMQKIVGRMSIQDVEEIPQEVRKLFVTAHDIAPEWHVKMQAAFQKYVDNAVSKTINLPNWATPQDIDKVYTMAYELNCKGITVYRDASKSTQVLQAYSPTGQKSLETLKSKHEKADEPPESIEMIKARAQTYTLSTDKEHKCPDCGTVMIASEGCYTCPKCGFSECS